MTALENYSLSDRYTNDEGRVFMTGVQALARLPISQLRADHANGLNTAAFLSGYQGSPLGGFDQEIERALRQVKDLPVVFKPAVNEELGASAVMGSQIAPTLRGSRYDGVLGIWYGKAPGIDRASDALRHAVFAGSSKLGGAVALVGDDPACKSSTLPSSSDMTMMNLKMPVLYPGDVQEVLDLSRHAVALSRFTGLWSAMKIVTAVADGTATVDLSPARMDLVRPDDVVDGQAFSPQPNGNLITPFTNEMEREIAEVRLLLARRYSEANRLNRVTVNPSDAWIGFVATGYTYRELLSALRQLGFDGEEQIKAAGIRLMQLAMPFPLAAQPITDFARGLERVVVVEEKGPALEWLLKDVLYNSVERPVVVGRDGGNGSPVFPQHGFLGADQMVAGLRSQLSPRLASRMAPEPAPVREKVLIPLSTERSPYFCSGCPHNWGTKVPEGSLVGAGIGCSGMAMLMDTEKVGDITGVTCMGNEGSQWIGMEPFLEDDHYIQTLGDGTFFHSGQLAIQAAVAAGANMTYKLLYNGTVAMTGGQDAQGDSGGVPEIVQIAVAHGVTEVIVTTEDLERYRNVDLPGATGEDQKVMPTQVWSRTRIVEAQEYLATRPGVTLLVHDQACAAQNRRLRKRGLVDKPGFRIAINHRICEACGDCGEVSNCLSVQTFETDLGSKTMIDQTTCNLDFSCLEGDCPSFMTVEVDETESKSGMSGLLGRLGKQSWLSKNASPDSIDELPDPAASLAVSKDGVVNVRFAGIGGTGVITVAQIMGTAAMLDGWNVRGLDQTGLSQKAGPVVSDLRLSQHGPVESNLIGAGEADTIIGFDLLVAAADKALAAASAGRTVVVASATVTPTGEMIGQPDKAYPETSDMADRVALRSRPEHNRYADAGRITKRLFGDSSTANVFLLGVGTQIGAIPVSCSSIERAIELNGVAVDANIESFRWGRKWANDQTGVEQILADGEVASAKHGAIAVSQLSASLDGKVSATSSDSLLVERLRFLAGDLVDFQDENYAHDFLDFVAEIHRIELDVDPTSTKLTVAVANGLHKLMAYKDEYEVARLLLAPEADATSERLGGKRAKVSWKLHPPMLKSLGMDSKITIDRRVGAPMMKALAAGKRLRGTALDPFGKTALRRLERTLITEYRAAIRTAASTADASGLDPVTNLAASAMEVRGFEELKVQRAEVFRAKLRKGTNV